MSTFPAPSRRRRRPDDAVRHSTHRYSDTVQDSTRDAGVGRGWPKVAKKLRQQADSAACVLSQTATRANAT